MFHEFIAKNTILSTFPQITMEIKLSLNVLGFIGNGSYCAPPPRYDSGFLLLSQGVAAVRIPFDGKRGRPVTMMSVRFSSPLFSVWNNFKYLFL